MQNIIGTPNNVISPLSLGGCLVWLSSKRNMHDRDAAINWSNLINKHATYDSGYPQSGKPKIGGFFFLGYTDGINFGDVSFVDFDANNFAFCSWVKYLDYQTDNPLFYKGPSFTEQQFSFVITSGFVVITIHRATNGTDPQLHTSSDTLSENVWYHLVGQRNGSNLEIYINGISSGSTSISGTMTQANTDFVIGGLSHTYSESLYGYMDEIMVFNRALSAQEIRYLYEKDLGRLDDISLV